MSWFSKATGIHINSINDITKPVAKAAVDTGHFIGKAADNPWVQAATAAALAATGVGAPAAAAIMAAERGGGALLKPGGNIGQGLVNGAEGAAMGYGASKLGDVARSAFGGGAAGVGGAPATDVIGGYGGAPATSTAGNGGILNTVKNILSKTATLGGGTGGSGTGGGDILDKILLGASIADTAASRKKATDLQNQGLGYATDAWNANAPLRTQGVSMLTNNKAPDLSSIFANPANPYYRNAPPVQLGTAVPVSAGATG